jgi:hypothetical protein
VLDRRDRGLADAPDAATRRRWHARYHAAVGRLRQAGIRTLGDPDAGADAYVALRQQWDAYVVALSEYMAYDVGAIDPAGYDPQAVPRRPVFARRLHRVP